MNTFVPLVDALCLFLRSACVTVADWNQGGNLQKQGKKEPAVVQKEVYKRCTKGGEHCFITKLIKWYNREIREYLI